MSAIVLCISALGSAVVPSVADAGRWDVGFQPRLEIGVANYSLDFSSTVQPTLSEGTAVSTGKLSFRDTLPTVGAGLTMFADRFFLDLAAQGMFNGSVSDSNTLIISSPGSVTTGQVSYESDFSRAEYALSLGYGITESVSVYAGYKWQRGRFNDLEGAGPIQIQIADGSALGGTFFTSADYEFDYDGPFVGVTTSWAIGSGALKGRLALNAAIAFLQGTLDATSDAAYIRLDNGLTVGAGTPSDVFDTSGNSVGVLIGASWLGQTNIAGLSYSVAINGYSYDFNADTQGKADINESVVQLKVGLAYAF